MTCSLYRSATRVLFLAMGNVFATICGVIILIALSVYLIFSVRSIVKSIIQRHRDKVDPPRSNLENIQDSSLKDNSSVDNE